MRWLSFLVLIPVGILLGIAASDGLFFRTVPLEQRLLSRNETIRKKAQQTLLGETPDQKQQTAQKLIPALSQTDPFGRKWAAISLALIGPAAQGAIPALLQDVSDKENEVAQAARVALGEIGAPDPGQLPTLIQALSSSSEATQCEAVASIAKLGPSAKEALPALFSALTRQALPDCYIPAVASLNDFLPDVETTLSTLVLAKNLHVRRRAALVLTHIPAKSPATIEALFRALAEEKEESAKQTLADALNLHASPLPGFAPNLILAVQDSTDANVRYDALVLLKKHVRDEMLLAPALDHALHDDDVEIRRAALEWLLQKPEWTRLFAPTLFGLLKDSVPDHRRMALSALYNVPWHGKEHVVEFALMQRDPDAQVRCLAVRQLVEMDQADRVSVGRLTLDLKQELDPVCAVEALAGAGYFNADVVPMMMDVLEEKDWRAQSRAILVLMHLGTRAKAALPALLRAQRAEIPGAENAVNHLKQALAREKRRHFTKN